MGSLRLPPSIVDLNGRPIYKLGYVKNPMLQFPGNLACWCGSPRQAKNCCLPRMAAFVPPDDAKIGEQFLAWVHQKRKENPKFAAPSQRVPFLAPGGQA